MQQRKDPLNKVEGLIEAHINEIVRLMAKKHFEQFFFDEYQPTILLPIRPFVTASYFEGKESVSKTIFLRSHARISQIVHGNVYGVKKSNYPNKTLVLSGFSTTFRAKEIDLPSYMAETSTLFMKLLCKKTKNENNWRNPCIFQKYFVSLQRQMYV